MPRLTDIGALEDYPEGEIRASMLEDGTLIAVYNVEGTLYATADRCTHGEASLSEEGKLCGGTVVECPWHNGTFDVATGKALTLPCSIPLKTYRIELHEQRVHVVED